MRIFGKRIGKRKKITESDHLENIWYEEAEKQTVKSLPKFVDHLMNDYEHDYGTICKAVAAAGAAAMAAADRENGFRVSGWQRSFIAWELLRAWGTVEKGEDARLIKFRDMLNPDYEPSFNRIGEDVFARLQEQARKELRENGADMDLDTMKHLMSIVDGKVPFGYSIGRI